MCQILALYFTMSLVGVRNIAYKVLLWSLHKGVVCQVPCWCATCALMPVTANSNLVLHVHSSDKSNLTGSLAAVLQEMSDAFYATKMGKTAFEAATAPYKGSERQTRSLATTRCALNYAETCHMCTVRVTACMVCHLPADHRSYVDHAMPACCACSARLTGMLQLSSAVADLLSCMMSMPVLKNGFRCK